MGVGLALRVASYAPQLLDLTGCGPLVAGKLIGETAGIGRFRTDAQLARLAGVAPLDASSGQQRRFPWRLRLWRGRFTSAPPAPAARSTHRR
jgi:transposase